MSFLKRDNKTLGGLETTRRSWFVPLAGLFQRGHLDETVWDEAEELLINADVGVSTTMTLLERVRQRLRKEGGANANPLEFLKAEMRTILAAPKRTSPPLGMDGISRPMVILVVGVNGAGKTTSIAKLGALFREEGLQVVLGAADTFRAAASEQLQVLGQRIGATVIAQRSGADPSAVAYDAFQAARTRGADILIVDTAGRLHTKFNLMEEMKKIRRILSRLDEEAPHQTLLVLDATTGQNGLHQARSFTEAISCTGIILAKLDGTARGGMVLAICDELQLPVLYVGTGEDLEDLAPFDPEEFVDALFASSPREAPL